MMMNVLIADESIFNHIGVYYTYNAGRLQKKTFKTILPEVKLMSCVYIIRKKITSCSRFRSVQSHR